MNRQITYTYSNSRTARRPVRSRRLSAGEWIAIFALMLHEFFAQSQVRMFCRLMAGGAAFMTMLGVVGGIECGNIGLLPGTVCCAALVLVAFLLIRHSGEDAR
ncbi:MAG: hypothetical protein IKL84_08605 [Clostridia bacterium]|nr:hypothetical protein [Clostridia bacterium]